MLLSFQWGAKAFQNMLIVPPGSGIVHQVNLEYLARVVFNSEGILYPDSVVGTDSHTTMINGLGVLGWGVGGKFNVRCVNISVLGLLKSIQKCRFKVSLKFEFSCTILESTFRLMTHSRSSSVTYVPLLGKVGGGFGSWQDKKFFFSRALGLDWVHPDSYLGGTGDCFPWDKVAVS
jgi:hypothetical protein